MTIRYYGPDPATGGVAEQTVTVTAPFTSVSFSFNATAGPRVIRAYQGTPAMAGDWSTAPIKSAPVRLMLQAGGQAKDLVLQ